MHLRNDSKKKKLNLRYRLEVSRNLKTKSKLHKLESNINKIKNEIKSKEQKFKKIAQIVSKETKKKLDPKHELALRGNFEKHKKHLFIEKKLLSKKINQFVGTKTKLIEEFTISNKRLDLISNKIALSNNLEKHKEKNIESEEITSLFIKFDSEEKFYKDPKDLSFDSTSQNLSDNDYRLQNQTSLGHNSHNSENSQSAQISIDANQENDSSQSKWEDAKGVVKDIEVNKTINSEAISFDYKSLNGKEYNLKVIKDSVGKIHLELIAEHPRERFIVQKKKSSIIQQFKNKGISVASFSISYPSQVAK